MAALVLALVFMAAEVVGGLLAHSLAILADAAHLLSDTTGFLVAALAAAWAKRAAPAHLSFGYHRVEVRPQHRLRHLRDLQCVGVVGLEGAGVGVRALGGRMPKPHRASSACRQARWQGVSGCSVCRALTSPPAG